MNYIREEYETVTARAEYYVWQALRNQPIAGGDPITGIPRNRSVHTDTFRAEGRAAYKAMARYWLCRARQLRAHYPQFLA